MFRMNEDNAHFHGSTFDNEESQRDNFTSNSDDGLGVFIFPDIRALYHIRLHKCSDLVYDEIQLTGFEMYIVEQWVAEGKVSSLITCFTGNSKDAISAVQVLLPLNPNNWPSMFRKYYMELMEVAKPKTIPEGTLFITNLFTVDSKLNLLHIECGDIRLIWDNFKVNFDLKRLHCGGRSALLLNFPTTAAEDKFSQIYKISMDHSIRDSFLPLPSSSELSQTMNGNKHGGAIISSYNPIIDFVSLLQIALSYFDLFSSDTPKEGIIYDEIKRAINIWWEQYGKLYMGIEKPKNEAALGTRTVAAIFSFVLSCHSKLVIADCTNSKDPFEEEEFISAIFSFQKRYNIQRNQTKVYLDHQTLDKLFAVSHKTYNSDIFKLKKAVKSTVLDIAGKRSKLLANEIITIDFDEFIQNIDGGSLGLLWKGKGRLRKSARSLIGNEAFCKIKYHKGDINKAVRDQHIDLLRVVKEQPSSTELNGIYSNSPLPGDGYPNTNNTDSQNFDLKRFDSNSSSMSLSSMICNYDENKYKLNYGINVTYQREYYRRNSIPFFNDGTRNLYTSNKNKECFSLHRSASFSKVQDVIENWELPFDPSLIKMARDLLKVKVDLGIKNIEKHKKKSFADLVEENSGLIEDEERFFELKKELQNSYNNYIVDVKKIDNIQSGIKKKKELVNNEMHELESLISKLRYNMRILDRRMRDVEHSVRHLDTKLRSVEKSFMVRDTSNESKVGSLLTRAPFEDHLKTFIDTEDCNYNSVSAKLINKYYLYFKEIVLSYFSSFQNNASVNNQSETEKTLHGC
ncbi:hypothetical protein TPHA_0L01860 [Tetrapisispora phaffii CBS 4417]|uniref:STB6-like N-terminal domain-containing protein n=1 Tax=Tetrapisispora phaffii (strain ATCC 24235 / CBS 4417 / NBRC 1672 / NRRL Y-8282 / UCD 70-5) TaxID=1071381 RepID=G8C061_TETPH|nr:hypothetical protein TPHA_0L01860 [Tetrapisispora phaffii CBS 4417]CCE65539.1 hypothetical protein TPHA_0L01860 [Tetrapisispora phaffii CBS 4417]